MRRIVGLTAILAIVGCGQPISPPATIAPKPKVAFVSNNPDPFWSIVEAGCLKAANENGVELVFKKPASGDPAIQQEIIESLVNNNIKAIALSVIDPKNQTAYLNEVAAKV